MTTRGGAVKWLQDRPMWARKALIVCFVALLCLYCCGCTTTRWERVDELGAVLKGQQTTFIAKTDLSAITAKAEGDAAGYKMDIGSTADGQDSTQALAAMQALLEIARILGPLFAPVPAATPALPVDTPQTTITISP